MRVKRIIIAEACIILKFTALLQFGPTKEGTVLSHECEALGILLPLLKVSGEEGNQ